MDSSWIKKFTKIAWNCTGVDAIKQIYGSNLQKNCNKMMSGAIKQKKIEKNNFTEKFLKIGMSDAINIPFSVK